MADVVATIQAEQDRVIRADLPGVLVVQGGPGTGKTVAALHRAAYLLYTHRRILERRGVLVIGPNATFLRYISQVLPSLGETDVVLHTLGDLFPGVHATDTRDPAAVIKGDERMVRVLQQAVRDRQAVPKRDIIVNADGVDVPLAREAILRARDRARSTRKPHNVARKLFVTELLTDLARAEARVLNRPLDEEDLPGRARPAVGHRRRRRRARRAVAAAHTGNAARRACCGRRRRSGPPPAPSLMTPNGSGLPVPATRRAGRWRTYRCSTRPPNCSASTTPRSRRRAGRRSAPAAPSRSTRRRYSTRPSSRAWSSP